MVSGSFLTSCLLVLPESCSQCLYVTDPYSLSLEVFPITTPLSSGDGAAISPPPTSDWTDLMNYFEAGSDPVVSPFHPTQPANASLANSQSGSSSNAHYLSQAPQNPLYDSSWLTYPPTTTQPDFHPRPNTLASEAFYRPYTALPNAPRLAVSLNINPP